QLTSASRSSDPSCVAQAATLDGRSKSTAMASTSSALTERRVSTTRWPRQRNARTTALPMQPLEPQTRILMTTSRTGQLGACRECLARAATTGGSAEQLLDARAEAQHLEQGRGVELEHLLAPRGERLQELEGLFHARLDGRGFLAQRRVGEQLAQDADRGCDLASLALADDGSHQLPDVGRRLVVIAPVVAQMDEPHQSPVLQLAQARADVRAG